MEPTLHAYNLDAVQLAKYQVTFVARHLSKEQSKQSGELENSMQVETYTGACREVWH
jgi:hypothetical protein